MAGKRRENLTCARCSQLKREIKIYPRSEIINFKGKNLCKQCYQEAKEQEEFINYVCELFGLKSPGPKIYTQRKNLKEKYGYTDKVIIRTLEYLFRVKKKDKAYESLGLINPKTVEEAARYFEKNKDNIELELDKTEEIKVRELIVPIKEPEKKVDLLSYDFLED